MQSEIPPFWRFQLAGWATFEILSFPLKVAILGTIEAAIIASILRDGMAFWLTLGLRFIYRRAYRERMPIGRIAMILLIGCLGAGSLLTLFSLILERIIALEEEQLFGALAVFRLFYFCTSIFVGWSFLYFGIKLMRDADARELRLAKIDTARREAELQMLRAQMNPHFLFNALNTIRAGIGEKVRELIPVIDGLAGYLRFSLAHRKDDLVAMQDEFEALVDYLSVEKARFGDELELDCQIDSAARKIAVPGVLLQPLVENSIKYGRTTSPVPLRVRIRVVSEPGFLLIEVANSGRWVEPQPHDQLGGVGSGNLRQRLSLLYPGRHNFDLTTENGWVQARIRIPTRK